jgi:hypothetical protein
MQDTPEDNSQVWCVLGDSLPIHAKQNTLYKDGIQLGSRKTRCSKTKPNLAETYIF